MKYICEFCNKEFNNNKSLACHKARCTEYLKYRKENENKEIEIKCEICGKVFKKNFFDERKTCSISCSRKLSNKNHGNDIHNYINKICVVCGNEFLSKDGQKENCSDCGMFYKEYTKYLKKNNISSNEISYKQYSNFEEIECKYCHKKKKFRESDIILHKIKFCCNKHENLYNNLEKRNCEICNKEFVCKKSSKQKTCGEKSCNVSSGNITKRNNGIKMGFASDSFKKRISDKCLKEHGVLYYCMTPQCIKANKSKISQINKEFMKLLDSYNINYESEFAIGKFSYDIRINNFLIEINPTYTHNSTISSRFNKPKKKNYHFSKTINAMRNNYFCIHVFDWDNWDKIIDIINPNKQILYKRNLELKKVNKKDCDEFLNKYHLQKTCRGQNIILGLFHNDELVQIMTFGKPRYNKNYQYELLRLCTKSGYKIVGGSNSLFKYFIKNYDPESIISYCDNSKFNGDVYKKLGFKFEKITEQSCHWYNWKTCQHFTDNLLRQRGADQLLNVNYGKGTNNEEIMLKHGFVQVYDCGQKLWSWKKGEIK